MNNFFFAIGIFKHSKVFQSLCPLKAAVRNSNSGSSSSSDANLTAQNTPSNGAILSGKSKGNASYKVTAPSSSNCYAKVIGSGGSTQVSFFVRKGSTATVSVPAGTYRVHFAMGDTWYGTSDRFGSGTVYGQDSQSVTLSAGDQMTYKLQLQSNGNFSMGSLDASDF